MPSHPKIAKIDWVPDMIAIVKHTVLLGRNRCGAKRWLGPCDRSLVQGKCKDDGFQSEIRCKLNGIWEFDKHGIRNMPGALTLQPCTVVK
jgi:hypothetical protein